MPNRWIYNSSGVAELDDTDTSDEQAVLNRLDASIAISNAMLAALNALNEGLQGGEAGRGGDNNDMLLSEHRHRRAIPVCRWLVGNGFSIHTQRSFNL